MRKGNTVYANSDIELFPGIASPIDVDVIKRGSKGKIIRPIDNDGHFLVRFEDYKGEWFIYPEFLSTRKVK